MNQTLPGRRGGLNGFGRHVERAQSDAPDPARAVAELASGLGHHPLAAVILFVSPSYDLAALAAATSAQFDDTCVIGCTTAGEISAAGYAEDSIVAIGLPRRDFCVQTTTVRNLTDLSFRRVAAKVLDLRSGVVTDEPDWQDEFAFLMVDGLSLREDRLVAAISTALGTTPLFGGSAGDGMSFGETRVLSAGVFESDAAVLALIRTRCRVKVFRFDHFVPTETRMVVTDADPENRVVREINAEPAAREYARMVGKDPNQLSPFIFAAHPVVVRVGGQHHVRAIQRVDDTGHLRFFSAIDEGLVLTVADSHDIVTHLEDVLTGLEVDGQPDAILACDCILRKLEAEQSQVIGRVSEVLARHRVTGFSTYGEQHNNLHVNQTFTGVAIYPPLSEAGI